MSLDRSPDGKRTYWRRIGCAIPHETGNGLTVQLDALPRDGRIVLLEPDDQDEKRLQERLRRHTAKPPTRTEAGS